MMQGEIASPAMRSESPESMQDRHNPDHVHFGLPQTTEPESEAGPSSPRSHRRLELTTSRNSDADNIALENAINAKRRKSSLLPGIQLHYPHRKRRGSAASSNDGHGIHESPETMAHNIQGRDDGVTVPDITDHDETDEGRAVQEELDNLLEEAENSREPGKKEITLLLGAASNGKGKEPEVWKGFAEEEDPTGEYVWECKLFTAHIAILS